MSSELEAQVIYNVANAPLRTFPYSHIFVENVFPASFYASLQAHIPDPEAMTPIGEARRVVGYDQRFVLDIDAPPANLPKSQAVFWQDLKRLIVSGPFRSAILEKFRPDLQRRFGDTPVQFMDETLLVQDVTRYALGPHTDHPSKAVTVLFYLPKDMSQSHLGTSIYMPKNRERRCAGGPHYKRQKFDRVATMPFVPNSMFAFVKTDVSFHGVEEVEDPDTRRWLLLYDIMAKPADAKAPEAAS